LAQPLGVPDGPGAFRENRIAVRFAYESLDPSGQWWRSYGNENWEFAETGLMKHRHASINDLLMFIPGLSELGL
jgi:nuclear transport factor 2 (NTF2) superfamily protein